MSTYAVFGMTRHRAMESARKSVPVAKDGEVLPESEWLALVDAEADKIMRGSKVIQLSEKFDAPDFAEQFLEIARKTDSRDLHIKANVTTGGRSEKTGRPKTQWIEPPAA